MKSETAPARNAVATSTSSPDGSGRLGRPSAGERLATPEAFLSRGDLRELGLERRAVDAIFRTCPVVCLPGYARPLIRVRDYLAMLELNTYGGDRVRP